MSENIFITTKQEHGSASTLAQQYGGAVAVSCLIFITQNGGLYVAKSELTMTETHGLKITEWKGDGDYIGSEVEKTFSTSGIMIKPGTYVISGSLYNDVNTLNKNTNLNVFVVDENGIKILSKK